MEFTADLDAFQGSEMFADPNVTTSYFMRNRNEGIIPEAGYTDSNIKHGGAKEIGVDNAGKPKSKGHHASFFPASDLPSSNKNSSIKKDINQNE